MSKYDNKGVIGGDSVATETVAGNVELATDVETLAGTATTVVITPANLKAMLGALTDNCVLVGSAAAAITALTAATNGQLLVGSTGADPVFATVTDGEGITTTLGAGTFQIDCEDGTATNKGVLELATDEEVQTGTDTARAITAANLRACVAQAARIGVVELATAAEVAAGTDTERAVTASGLASTYQYDTIFIPAGAMAPTDTNGGEAGSNEYGTNDNQFDYYAFDTTTEEYVAFSAPMPENWDRSTIKAKFFWTTASGSSENDTVEWQIAGQAISNDDALDVAMGDAGEVISDAVTDGVDADLHITAATPAVTIGGTPALGDLIHFKISRNVGGTDDCAEDAWLLGVWIQYKITNEVAAW